METPVSFLQQWERSVDKGESFDIWFIKKWHSYLISFVQWLETDWNDIIKPQGSAESGGSKGLLQPYPDSL